MIAQDAFLLPDLYWGTVGAPHSDALVPWLHGALSYYFSDRPPTSLYRPTVGIFFASILSIFFDTRAIPLFYSSVAVLLVARSFHWLSERNTVAVCLLIAMTSFGYADFFSSVAPWTLMTDFSAWLFTLAGLLLSLQVLESRRGEWLALAILPLGISAAIRGPMLVGGIAILVLALFRLRHARHGARNAALATVALFLPFLVDIAIQRTHGVINNGLTAMYCFYAEPAGAGTYSPACWSSFVALKPEGTRIFADYLAFLISPLGMAQTLSGLGNIWSRATLPILGFLPVLVIACAVYALACFRSGPRDFGQVRHLTGAPVGLFALMLAGNGFLPELLVLAAAIVAFQWWPRHAMRDRSMQLIRIAAAVIVLVVAAHLANSISGSGFFALCVGLGIPYAAWRLRSVWVAGLYAAYFASAVFLAVLGLVFGRLIETFSFALHLAFLIAVVELLRRPPVQPTSRPEGAIDRPSILGVAAALGFLYSATFLPSLPEKREIRKHFEEEARNGHFAIKVSSEQRLNLSLYVLGTGNLVYSEYDTGRPGAIVRFARIVGADGGPPEYMNESRSRPVCFVKQAGADPWGGRPACRDAGTSRIFRRAFPAA